MLLQDGQTPLHTATCYNQVEIVKFLIIKGAKLDIKDKVSAYIC